MKVARPAVPAVNGDDLGVSAFGATSANGGTVAMNGDSDGTTITIFKPFR